MSHKRPDDYQNYGNQEDDNGDAVHAMHQKDVDIAWLIRVSFLQEQVLLDLIPDAAPMPLI
jgi:hypothetical protein